MNPVIHHFLGFIKIAFEKMERENLDEFENWWLSRYWGPKASAIDATQKSFEQVVDDWIDKK
jgi:hypothetical protein